MFGNQSPFIFNRIYRTIILNHIVLYNPFSYKGLFILNSKYQNIIDQIDGVKTIDIISRKFAGVDKDLTKQKIYSLFRQLLDFDIISFSNKNNYFHRDHNNNFIKESLGLWINLTSQCNFRCTYCFVEKKTRKMSFQLIDQMLKNIYSSARIHNLTAINFNIAGGEPLSEPRLLTYLVEKINSYRKDLKYKKVRTSVAIITNGSLLTENLAAFLKRNNVYVGISIDGIGKYHDHTRRFANGKGTFEKVKKGLQIAIKFNIILNTICTINDNNYIHLPKLIKFFQSHNLNFILHFFRKVNVNCDGERIKYNNEIVSSYKAALKLIYADYYRRKLPFSPLYMARNKLLDMINLIRGVSKYSCTAGINFFAINTDGTICGCPSEDTRVLGHISDSDFLTKIRKQSSWFEEKLDVENIKDCVNCLWKYTCRGMCRLERDFDKPEAKCAIIKDIIPYVIKLEASRIILNNIRHIYLQNTSN